MLKAKNSLLPISLAKYINPSVTIFYQNVLKKIEMYKFKKKSAKSCAIFGPKLWCMLLEEIRQSAELAMFKRKLLLLFDERLL